MGFFTSIGATIGSIFGPVGTAVGASIGGALDGKKARKAQERAIAEQNRIATIAAENASRPVTTKQEVDFEGTIKSARNAGYNPLTALRATGGNITGTTTRYVAPLLSSMPTRNYIDIMEDAFNGYQSFQKGKINTQKEGLEMQYLKNQVANSNPLNNFTPTINSRDILTPVQTVKNLTSRIDTTNPFSIYEVEQSPVKLDYVQSDKGIVSAEQKSMLYVYVDPWGIKWRLPGEELEISNLLGGSAVVATAGASKYMRDAGNFIQNLGTKYRDKRYNTEVNLLQKLQNQMTIKNSPLGIRGLTSGIRKTQDEINGFVRSAY